MKLNLRPLRKPFWFAGVLLVDRLRTLWRRPWTAGILAVMLLGSVLVAARWPFEGWDPRYVPAFLLILAVQITGALNHPWAVAPPPRQLRERKSPTRRPWEARRSVRHPLPRGYFWLVQLLCVAALVGLVGTLEAQDWAEPLYSNLVFVLLFTPLTTTLPWILRFFSSALRRLGMTLHLPRLRLRPLGAYALCLVGAAGTIVYYAWGKNSASNLFFTPFVGIVTGLVLMVAPLLWRRSARVFWVTFAQLGFWVFLVLVALEGSTLGDFLRVTTALSDWAFIPLFVASELALFVAALYQLWRRLKFSPVIPVHWGADESLSVQTDPHRYVDTTGQARALLTFIGRSDGGVVGLTGVRGAGKSALATHVLQRLEKHHFVLSMTAPIRHDPGLGFLLTVSRAVCRRVLDDVNRGLRGHRTDKGRAFLEVLRRLRAVLVPAAIAAVAVLLLLEKAPGLLGDPDARKTSGDRSRLEVPTSVAEACDQLHQGEYWLIAGLLRQAEAVFKPIRAQGSPIWEAGFLIVPNMDQGFLLVVRQPQVLTQSQLTSLKPRRFLGLNSWYAHLLRGTGQVNSRLLASPQSLLEFCAHEQGPFLQQHTQAVLRVLAEGRSGLPNLEADEEATWLGPALVEAFLRGSPALEADNKRLRQLITPLRAYMNLLVGRPPLDASVGSSPSFVESQPASYPRLTRGLVIIILVLLLGGLVWRALSSLARALVNWRYAALARQAEQFLEMLNYSESRETSGGLSWQAFSFSRSRSLAARELTLPALTARYVEFVASARRFYNGKMVIAIDELDKIPEPEEVKKVLTEIKGALFAKGCFYLLSISEDATRSFRQRLSAGRDIFESTFDDVLEVPPMNVEAASRLLALRQESRRAERRLPEGCYFVLALFAGGIPREIVRHLRRVALDFEDASSLTPPQVAEHLMRIEVREWLERLGEVELSGSDALELMGEAEDALAIFHPRPKLAVIGDSLLLDAKVCGQVWDRLDACLALLDPEGLRETANRLASAEPSPELLRYRALLDDIQAVLRLMILTVVCELTCAGSVGQEQERAILAAHRALAHQPALTERMVRDLRRDAHASALV